MSTPAYDTALFLGANGYVVGGANDWCVNVAAEPPAPSNTITLYDLSGGTPDTDQLDLLNVRVQMRIKAIDYLAGYAKAEAIRDLLILVAPQVMNGKTYVGIELESDIWSLGRNDQNQYLIVANFVGLKQRT